VYVYQGKSRRHGFAFSNLNSPAHQFLLSQASTIPEGKRERWSQHLSHLNRMFVLLRSARKKTFYTAVWRETGRETVTW
jgi:hypothetical protein